MNAKAILAVALISLGFGGWGVAGRYSGAGSAWVGIYVLLGTMVGMLSSYAYQGQLKAATPGAWAVFLLLMAGCANGIAVGSYTAYTTNPQIPAGVFMAMVSVLMVVWAQLLSAAFLHEGLSLKQCFGLALCVSGVWMLKPS